MLADIHPRADRPEKRRHSVPQQPTAERSLMPPTAELLGSLQQTTAAPAHPCRLCRRLSRDPRTIAPPRDRNARRPDHSRQALAPTAELLELTAGRRPSHISHRPPSVDRSAERRHTLAPIATRSRAPAGPRILTPLHPRTASRSSHRPPRPPTRAPPTAAPSAV